MLRRAMSNSAVEADVALGRCAPSGPRSLTPVRPSQDHKITMPMSSYYRSLRDRVRSELLLVPAVAAVLRDEKGRVLIQRNHQGGWSLPA